MKRAIRKAVIPAAGSGTRFLPATRVVPKELLPVAGKPLIQYAVEEASASGIETVILVLRKGKEQILEHLRSGEPAKDAESQSSLNQIHIETVFQESPLGLADAVRTARNAVAGEPFAVILPDALIDSSIPCLAQLIACYENHPGCIVATQRVQPQEVERFGIVERSPVQTGDAQTFLVSSLVERPPRTETSSPYGIFGRYVLDPEIFECIDATQPGFRGELQLTDSLRLWAASRPLYAHIFDGMHYDAGSKLGFLQANIAFSLHCADTAAGLREYVMELASQLESSREDLPAVLTASS